MKTVLIELLQQGSYYTSLTSLEKVPFRKTSFSMRRRKTPRKKQETSELASSGTRLRSAHVRSMGEASTLKHEMSSMVQLNAGETLL